MKSKLVGVFSIIIFLMLIISACSSSDTYSDKVKKEGKEIRRFMNEHNFEVIRDYPVDSIFEENQFYRDPSTGVYINVINAGNGHRAKEADYPTVTYRFWETFSLPASQSDTVSNNNSAGLQPITFTYGLASTYNNMTNSSSYEYSYLSAGVTVPLKYVGENAIVRLIVPFSQGSTYQNFSYRAVYYGYLQYTSIE